MTVLPSGASICLPSIVRVGMRPPLEVRKSSERYHRDGKKRRDTCNGRLGAWGSGPDSRVRTNATSGRFEIVAGPAAGRGPAVLSSRRARADARNVIPIRLGTHACPHLAWAVAR